MANTTDTSTSLQNSGFWGSLFSNAANGVDSLGRNTASNTTALGNWIVAMIQSGKGEYPTITYEKEDNTKYVVIAVAIIAVCVALIFILKD